MSRMDIYSSSESDIALKTREWSCSASILMLSLEIIIYFHVIIIYFHVIIYINSFTKYLIS